MTQPQADTGEIGRRERSQGSPSQVKTGIPGLDPASLNITELSLGCGSPLQPVGWTAQRSWDLIPGENISRALHRPRVHTIPFPQGDWVFLKDKAVVQSPHLCQWSNLGIPLPCWLYLWSSRPRHLLFGEEEAREYEDRGPSQGQTPQPLKVLSSHPALLPIPNSPLEAVKSMATVKLIWVLEEGEQQGSHLEGGRVVGGKTVLDTGYHPGSAACQVCGLGEVTHLFLVLKC